MFDCLDDHARYLLCALACRSPSAGGGVGVLQPGGGSLRPSAAAALRHTHACFTGRRHGVTVPFEPRLAKAGVQHLTSAPAHPQTLGKLERLHRTLKEWLAEQQVPVDLTELQTLLDTFKHHYNHERPHQGIGDHTPAERYRSGFPAAETAAASRLDTSEAEPRYPPHSILRKVWRNGITGHRNRAIIVGRRFAGAILYASTK